MIVEDLPPPPPYSEIYPSVDSDVRYRRQEPSAPPENYGAFPQNTVFQPSIVQDVGVTPVVKYGPVPVKSRCPNCKAIVETHTKRKAGLFTYLIFGGFILFGFMYFFSWLLSWVPFYMKSCLDVVHECPLCKRSLGRFKRL